jgi:phosphate transport system substrate-binding protein
MIACGGSDRPGDSSKPASTAVDLTGAGATFPYPLYSKWMSEYLKTTGVRINYQSLGSGAGIRQLSDRVVDFGASDSPMSDDEMSKAMGGPIMHVPMTLGAVAITYNVPGLAQPLKLTGEVIADIFLGKVTRWNDARITAINPGVTLPAKDLVVVHRSDGSGTTYIFTDYLTTVSPAWKAGPGRGKDVAWPVGVGGKGNEGVAGQVQQTEGAVGYVEIAYAMQVGLSTASVKNANGEFVAASPTSITAAAAGVMATLGPGTDYRISIINAAGPGAYPISSFTWILLYRTQTQSAKGRKLLDFLRWALTDGQAFATDLHYGPLPDAMRDRLKQRLDSIKLGPVE